MTATPLRPGAPSPAGGPSGGGPGPWSDWVDRANDEVAASGRWRSPRTFDAAGPAGSLGDGTGPGARPVVSFASNDYLGLTTHPAVAAAAHRAVDRWGTGSGASRLVTGSRPVHAELEAALAAWKRCERAVVFPTGFAANLSVLSVFGGSDACIFSDELNHASIVDGCRLARAPVTVYPHVDLGRLDGLMGRCGGRPIIVSDTVFSMDGDEADLSGLTALARRHGALLVLDEAHAVLGPELPPDRPGRGDVLRVGTLSKTLGALGGFVAGPARYTDYLVNRARPYIFTTAPTPADAAAALAAVAVVRSSDGEARRARLAGHVARVSAAVGRPGHPSPIVPLVVGPEAEALSASERLLGGGVWVPAIRPPTVAPGTSRLRITLSAAHTDDQVDGLIAGLVGAGLVPARFAPAESGAPALDGARAP